MFEKWNGFDLQLNEAVPNQQKQVTAKAPKN